MDDAAPTRKQRRIISENIDQTKPASVVVNKGGGLTNFSRDYDFASSTVHSWMKKGYVPSKTRELDGVPVSYQAWIMRRSDELGHGITAEDFVETTKAAA